MMQKKRYSSYSPLLIASVDLLVLVSLFFLFLFIHDPFWVRSLHGLLVFAKVHYKSLALIVLFWFLVAAQVGIYRRFRFSRFLEILRRVFFQTVFFAVILFAISGGKEETLYSSKESFYFLAILFLYFFTIN